MTLQPFIKSLSQQVPPISVTDSLLQSQALKAIFSHHTPFYPVVCSRNVGIYLTWEVASRQVSRQQVRKFKKTRTFVEAVEFMLTRGNKTTPTQSISLPLCAPVSPTHPSSLKLHISSRTMARPSVTQPTNSEPCKIYCLTRSLAGVVGEEYGPPDPSIRSSEEYPPCGLLGLAAEKYLDAHGYKGSTIFHILLGFTEVYCASYFVDYVCPRGVSQAEAIYIYELISSPDTWWEDYQSVY
ncbi:uncharacterized protein F5891DRAFT_1185944 [Suillus fuscotomentosus]|uniref:Ribonuclease H1 N-terminal domain-containing protein n=1 Tax=Suillus fuscotomentosus TaxID=1912939 RepID=A0AAD4EAS3_9AGAM|nr:uncharacterized protein F5891DRAFT_1185944 [Suillus fuscotomentosus]KAG1902814.1 hypothetical protein F5891DRAFT_1185944 [Suillus fuscotomentosus]